MDTPAARLEDVLAALEAELGGLSGAPEPLGEGMWGVAQSAISTLGFDFAAYADEHLVRVREGFADPRVPGWLEDAHAG